MPRKPTTKRVPLYLSPEQYDVLKDYTQYEYLGDDKSDAKPSEMAAAIRDVLSSAIPSFGAAKPLVGRGKYKRDAHDAQ